MDLARLEAAFFHILSVLISGLPIWTLLAGILAFVSALAHHAPIHEALLWGFAVMAVTAIAISQAWQLGARATRLFGTSEEGKRVADMLEEWGSTAHPTITLGEVTRVWAADAVGNHLVAFIQRSIKLNILKDAVRHGLLPSSVAQESQITPHTTCRTADVVRFFRARDWLRVPARH